MKYIHLLISASLMAIQVKGLPHEDEEFDLICDTQDWETASSSLSETTPTVVRIPEEPNGGSWIEVIPITVAFRKNNMFFDENDTGLRPNTEETVDQFAEALLGVTQGSLLQAFGFHEILQDSNVISNVLTGFILARAQRKINVRTAIIFLRMFREHAKETVLALTTIAAIIQNYENLQVKNIPRDLKSADNFLLTTLRNYYARSTEPTPISMKTWSEIAFLTEQLMNGETDAVNEIITLLAAQCEDFQSLNELDTINQQNIVITVTEDVHNFKKFLDYVKIVRKVRAELQD